MIGYSVIELLPKNCASQHKDRKLDLKRRLSPTFAVSLSVYSVTNEQTGEDNRRRCRRIKQSLSSVETLERRRSHALRMLIRGRLSWRIEKRMR
ncbi:hypothetical protein EVAR_46894_1 [Eumeta japonica]|uniref:Uncharacterized protein n=1 Tax=Eumeta variegata TaxID=151549 RepID=A0A4C1YFJ3_EUMVA|nr:hypothetical protein EVAR_46894_1 [Eumeta japonica]